MRPPLSSNIFQVTGRIYNHLIEHKINQKSKESPAQHKFSQTTKISVNGIIAAILFLHLTCHSIVANYPSLFLKLLDPQVHRNTVNQKSTKKHKKEKNETLDRAEENENSPKIKKRKSEKGKTKTQIEQDSAKKAQVSLEIDSVSRGRRRRYLRANPRFSSGLENPRCRLINDAGQCFFFHMLHFFFKSHVFF